MERRLQTKVFKQGLAKSIHHARVLIKQRHIRVGKQVVNVPSFMVRLDSEKHVDFAATSPYGQGRPGRVAAVVVPDLLLRALAALVSVPTISYVRWRLRVPPLPQPPNKRAGTLAASLPPDADDAAAAVAFDAVVSHGAVVPAAVLLAQSVHPAGGACSGELGVRGGEPAPRPDEQSRICARRDRRDAADGRRDGMGGRCGQAAPARRGRAAAQVAPRADPRGPNTPYRKGSGGVREGQKASPAQKP